MTQATLTLLNMMTNKPVFQITLCDPVTIFCDNSGTGKTALCTLSEHPSGTIYGVKYTGVDRLVVAENENDWIVLDSYKNVRTLVLVDEDFVDAFVDKIREYISTPGWYFLIITRDDKSLREIQGVRQVLRRLNGYTAINLPEDHDTVYYEDIPTSIDHIYVEDSATGAELYDAIIMGSADINRGCGGLGGVEYVSKAVCSQPVYDNTVFIFDRLTLDQLFDSFHSYIRESRKKLCLFTPICTEWLLLHSDMFMYDTDVQELLYKSSISNSDENLEHLALTILQGKDIGYSKEHGHLHWRLLTTSSIRAIGKQLPKPFYKYIESYTPIGNRHCNIDTLVGSIVDEYKAEIAACHPNREWTGFIRNIVRKHTDIVTPDGILEYLSNAKTNRCISEIMCIPSIVCAALESGATYDTLSSFLIKVVGETTTLTDEEIINKIRKIEQTT